MKKIPTEDEISMAVEKLMTPTLSDSQYLYQGHKLHINFVCFLFALAAILDVAPGLIAKIFRLPTKSRYSALRLLQAPKGLRSASDVEAACKDWLNQNLDVDFNYEFGKFLYSDLKFFNEIGMEWGLEVVECLSEYLVRDEIAACLKSEAKLMGESE